jgi:hypothetical protein
MPFAVADAVMGRGRRVVMLAVQGAADAERVKNYPHHWIAIGQAGRLLQLIKAEGCRDVVFIGSLVRPSLLQVRFDLQTILMLPRLVAAFRGGDNHLLSSIGRIGEQHGLRLLAAHEVAPEILVPTGNLTRKRPTERDRADIARALKVLRAMGPFDIGQAAIVADNHVLAVEGIDGTDYMLAHLADMRRVGRLRSRSGAGVLVKAPKRQQDRRYDMPAIGPQTVEAAVKAGLAGIAVVAGEAIIAEPERMIAAADRAKIFIVGVGKPR